MTGDWRPTATRDILKIRAAALARIRAFFAERDVLEVTTPALSAAATTEPHIRSLSARSSHAWRGRTLYLHTSPELAMKRLVAAGSGPVYQVCTVFRDDDAGRHHRPEFSMLEWYRPGWSYRRLIDEVEQLLTFVVSGLPEPAQGPAQFTRFTYRDLFRRTLDLDPETAVEADCRACCRRHDLPVPDDMGTGIDPWLDLLMAALIAPRLSRDTLTVVYDYPASQASLARTRDEPDGAVAQRFEIYWGPLELANGFEELTDADEQLRRFHRENAIRSRHGLPPMPIDGRFIDALRAGMPDCSGVALGVDRLLMAAVGARDIREVTAFADELPAGFDVDHNAD